MASGKRQPSKQKRTNQNRQERAARQARAAAARGAGTPGSAATSQPKTSLFGRLRGQLAGATGAAAATGASGSKPGTDDAPEPTSPAEPTTAPEPTATDTQPLTARPERAEPTTLLGRLRATAPAAPTSGAASDRPGATRARAIGGRLADPTDRPPGYRAALTGVIAALAAVVASFFLHSAVDVEGNIYTKPAIVAEWSTSALSEAQAAPAADAPAVAKAVDDWMPERGSDRLFLIYWPLSLAAVLPIIGAVLAFRAVNQRRPARVVTRAMYATLLGAFLTLGLLQFFLPTVIAVSVAGYQVRKAEARAVREGPSVAGPDAA